MESQLLLKDYDQTLDKNGLSGKRLAERLARLSEIGLTPSGGSHRLGFSKEEREAKRLVIDWMKKAGLEVKEDEAGNVSGRLQGADDNAPAVLSGSHVDTVPNGGHFDGTLGVLAALEVVEAWKETGFKPPAPFEVIIFSDEEGSTFNQGFTGSKAMVGDLDESVKELTDLNGDSFENVLRSDGLSADNIPLAARQFDTMRAFLEVHIEQGKRLEKENLPVGIVTGIAGPCWVKFQFTGEAGHAGNTPMDDRQDALVAASEFIYVVKKLPERVSSTAVATIGKISNHPNGVNVIPGEVELFVDIRDIDESARDQLVRMVIELGEKVAAKNEVSMEYKVTNQVKPIPVNDELEKVMIKAVEKSGLNTYFLPSGAGHDAMVLGAHLPMAMLFVRSKQGISHNPDEWSSLDDCVQSVHVLKQAVELIMAADA
ncbi:M20 family metallo-hydrolase [Halobacillus salinarum]|uniref:M20 family metallo-hydrolase n=1 Tax=Halobacillus salinarum TaxID=2932257 RepID=A0ABY4EEJ3_9BACI|nr:M20 family metallo-hydrolase [Halobacillus salinarum]UOQ42893.1 M20 family metallo-hydrolase [Halobacillus salinarum]